MDARRLRHYDEAMPVYPKLEVNRRRAIHGRRQAPRRCEGLKRLLVVAALLVLALVAAIFLYALRGARRGGGDLVNLYDLPIILLVAVSAWRGFRLGLVAELLRVLAFAVGLLLAFRFDGAVGRLLTGLGGLSRTSARLMAFFLILFVVAMVTAIVAHVLTRLISPLPLLGSVNRVAGALAGLALALVALWIVTAASLLLPSSLGSVSTTVRHSGTAHLMRSLTPDWNQRLRAYVDHFTAGHMDPALRRELQLLMVRQGSG